MPKPSLATQEIRLSQRLGSALKQLREELGISPTRLAQITGLSRSYLNYLEHGRFSDIGIAKFALIIQALNVSADEVMRQAGYLPPREDLNELADHLQVHYDLRGHNLSMALTVIEMLIRRPQSQPKTMASQ